MKYNYSHDISQNFPLEIQEYEPWMEGYGGMFEDDGTLMRQLEAAKEALHKEMERIERLCEEREI